MSLPTQHDEPPRILYLPNEQVKQLIEEQIAEERKLTARVAKLPPMTKEDVEGEIRSWLNFTDLSPKVFVVHGHDNELKLAVTRSSKRHSGVGLLHRQAGACTCLRASQG